MLVYTFHTLPVAGATLQMGGPIRFNITSPHRECIVDHRAGPRQMIDVGVGE